MTQAFSVLKIKSISETDDERLITGIASTPSQDRDNDIMNMAGAKFALPIPLLWQHNHNMPIGEIISAVVTDAGIQITAKIANIDEDGTLKVRIDEAWQSIKSGLVKCLSIGFRALEYNYLEDSYGLHIKEWELFEISVVTIPANADAVITSVKTIKQAFADAKNPTPTPVKTVTDPPAPKTTDASPVVTDEPPPLNHPSITLVDPNLGSIPLLTGDTL